MSQDLRAGIRTIALVVLLVVWPAATSAQGTPPPAATPAATPASTPAAASPEVQRALQAIEAEFKLLMDTYAQPLDAAALLEAAWRGAREAAGGPGAGGEPRAAGSAMATVTAALPAERGAAWSEFTRRFSALAANASASAGADPGALARAANRAMARSVADCHTRFEDSYEQERRSVTRGERYSGIGASVLDPSQFDPPAPGPVVVHLVDGAPAAAAGIRLGDAVLAVDGVEIAGIPSGRLAEMIRGAPGTIVRLRLERPGAAEPVEIAVERATVELKLLDWRYRPPDAAGTPSIGYLQLRSFSRPVEAALAAALDELRAMGATAWVLDLRGNGGGELRTFGRVASQLIGGGPLAVMVERSGSEVVLEAEADAFKDYVQPLAVLVDRNTASAAELLTIDLQEYGAARSFGTTTSGCFGISQLFPLPDGAALWLTVRALQSGLERRDIHKVGVMPDEEVARTRDDLVGGIDGPLARALAWVRQASGVANAPTAAPELLNPELLNPELLN
ncbi:MAG: PDZ domain-containing protein [Chloroflexi bacterium]|nr:PDZ domain-containing protein [Chloroflexota bacterium]